MSRVQSILSPASHRPFPMPARGFLMHQRWHDLLFAHWALPKETVEPLVPPPLRLELRDGRAWLGIVPFRMTGIRLRGTPAVPWLSAFCELNVRTYVEHRGVSGVFFASLDAANPLAVAAGRRCFHLPYYRARMALATDGDAVEYRSTRTHRGAPAADLVARCAPEGPPSEAKPGSLDHWLVERYCLFTVDRRGRVLRVDVRHAPWRLQAASAVIRQNSMTRGLGFELAAEPDRLGFARRLDVAVWSPAPAAE